MSKTIFVTGGAGYVGSHCAKAFAAAGWTVVTYDDLSRGHRDLVKWGPLIEGNILDQTALVAAMKSVQPDAVAH
ncbi:MAG: NAD-dependent epimerase/dehydratase family protein, partial [Pseudomonadota bacterium]